MRPLYRAGQRVTCTVLSQPVLLNLIKKESIKESLRLTSNILGRARRGATGVFLALASDFTEPSILHHYCFYRICVLL